MNADQLRQELVGTLWQGGARYWRGRVWYRPQWRVVDVRLEAMAGYWPGGNAPLALWAYMRRVDDNSATEPPGTVRRLSLENCLAGYERHCYPGFLTRVEEPECLFV